MPISSLIKKLEGITDPLIRQRYLKYFQLPPDLRQVIFAVETADKIRKAAKKNNLNDDQLWWASYITGMILLGEMPIVDFVKDLQKKCNLTEESARQLARDINQVIFLPVKESLKKVHQIQRWPGENEATQKQAILSKSPKISQENNGRVINLSEREKKTIPSPPETPKPRIEGNIVDLKGE